MVWGSSAAAGVAASWLLPPPASAAAAAEQDLRDLAAYDLVLPRVRFRCDGRVPDQWNVHPVGDRNLLEEFERVVRCKVKDMHWTGSPHYGETSHFNAVVGFDEPDRIFRFPVIFMTAEGHFTFSALEKRTFREYVEQGGFVLMDDCVYDGTGDYFYQSAFAMLTEVFGTEALRPIPLDHEVFHNVFDFGNRGLPWIQGTNHGAWGVFQGDRLAVFLSPTDLHCGWVDRNRGWFGRDGKYPGRSGYESAIKMGINILAYAMTH